MIALVGVVCFLSGFGVAAWMGWNFGQNYGVREYRRGQRNAWEWAEHDARVADLRAAHSEVAE